MKTSSETKKSLQNIYDQFDVLREEIRRVVGRLIEENTDCEFPTLQAKQEFARIVREYLTLGKLKIRCPICHQPCMLRACMYGSAKHGLFQFDHGKTNHGGTPMIPSTLEVVDAPIDKRLKNKIG